MRTISREITIGLSLCFIHFAGFLAPGSLPCAAEDFPSDIFSLCDENSSDEDPWNLGIWASFYGGQSNREEIGCIDNVIRPSEEYLVALPSRKDSLDCIDGYLQRKLDDETGIFRIIEIRIHGEEGPIFEATVEDVGPWYCGPDPYWVDGARPESEDGRDEKGRKTNRAGIDLGLLLAEDMGIDGIGKVDWRFKKIDGGYVVLEKETIFR